MNLFAENYVPLYMRLFLSLLFLLAILPEEVWSQNQPGTIELTGQIINQETSEPVPFVHIINKGSQVGTVSNAQGRFWMKLTPSDTLTFSAIGFEPYYFYLKDEVVSSRVEVKITLNTSTMELQPVKVFAFRDEESLKQAILDMDVTTTEDKERIELPGFYYGPMKPYKPSAFGSPISFIAGMFSKENKEQKLLEKARQESDYRTVIRAKYNEEVVMELTGLPEDEVADFMEFCKIEDAFIYRSGPYEIALAVSRCMTRFQEEQ